MLSSCTGFQRIMSLLVTTSRPHSLNDKLDLFPRRTECPGRAARFSRWPNATEPDGGKKRRLYGRKRNPSGRTRPPMEGPVAETEGFEPSVPFAQYDGLANRWFQPLTHVSRSEEHTSELQSLMRISYAVFCLNK